MSKFNLQVFLKDAEKALKKHSPEILTGIGITGMITSTVLAVRATPKALMLIEERKLDLNTEELSKTEVVKTTWKCYIPTFITTTLSTACIIGASSVNLRRNAALATAYTIADTARKEYRQKVIDTIGEKKEIFVRDAIAKDKVEANPIETQQIVITKNGDTMCYDPLSGRYFKSDIEKINKAINEINRRMLDDTYVSLNDFYYELELEETKIGNSIGWRVDTGENIKVRFSSHLASDGTPCVVFDFVTPPTYNFDRFA